MNFYLVPKAVGFESHLSEWVENLLEMFGSNYESRSGYDFRQDNFRRESNDKNENISFHKYPLTNSVLLHKWIKALHLK